jgi:5-hydroxyisourate hydrolase
MCRMSAITTHVLDTARGCPAAGVRVALEQLDRAEQWRVVGHGTTDGNGRLGTLLGESIAPAPGLYRLLFDTRAYFEEHRVRTFFPHVLITFEVSETDAHYHVPLLLSPFGYSTYRGS